MPSTFLYSNYIIKFSINKILIYKIKSIKNIPEHKTILLYFVLYFYNYLILFHLILDLYLFGLYLIFRKFNILFACYPLFINL